MNNYNFEYGPDGGKESSMFELEPVNKFKQVEDADNDPFTGKPWEVKTKEKATLSEVA